MAAADLILHPTESVLCPARMKMLADLADLQAKRSAAATAFRGHCKDYASRREIALNGSIFLMPVGRWAIMLPGRGSTLVDHLLRKVV
jgi:hypothetical protein